MHLLKTFAGPRWSRISAILESYDGLFSSYVNLIASASYPFSEVVMALGAPLFAFPAEGLPGRRYFPGSKPLDLIEERAELLLLGLFGLGREYRATIQPHSGTQANQIVFNAVLREGDLVLSLEPSQGGHISHTVLVGRRNPVIHYNLSQKGQIDYGHLASVAKDKKPRLIIAGGSSLTRAVDYPKLGFIARESGAFLHADISHTAIFILAGLHPPAFPSADFATFNTMKNLRGPCGGVLIYRSDFKKDVSRALFPGTQGGPIQNNLFAKLVCFERLSQIDRRAYAENLVRNARTLSQSLQEEGSLRVTDLPESHILMVDLRSIGLSGREAERICEHFQILANRNLVPDDPRPPWIGSGLRIGTTCITCLGYASADVRHLGEALALALRQEPSAHSMVRDLVSRYQNNLSTASVGIG